MKKEIKDLWVARLRDPNEKQTEGYLESKQGRCCLGVLCDIAIQQGLDLRKGIDPDGVSRFGEEQETGTLPRSVMEWSGIKTDNGVITPMPNPNAPVGVNCLAFINDEGATFSEIADIIEKHWENL